MVPLEQGDTYDIRKSSEHCDCGMNDNMIYDDLCIDRNHLSMYAAEYQPAPVVLEE